MMRSPLKAWGLLFVLLIGLPIGLLLGLWAWARWANSVPAYPVPPERLPNPNGYERAVRLAQDLPGPGLDTVYPGEDRRRLTPYLDKARPILDAVCATFRLEWDEPRDWVSDRGNGGAHPFTACAEYFVAESEAAQRRGDPGLALARRLDAVELGSRWTHGGTSLAGSGALSCLKSGCRGIETVLPTLPLSIVPSSLARVRRLQRAWTAYPDALDRTRLYVMTWISEAHRQPESRRGTPQDLWRIANGALSGVYWAPGELQTLLTPKRRPLRSLDRYFRDRIAECRKPLPLRRRVTMPADAAVFSDFDPAAYEGEGDWWAAQALLALLEVAFVVEQYRGVHGRYPARLDAISRRWLPAVPKDPWDQPLGYRLVGDQPVIYSRGPDGVDSGGGWPTPIEDLNVKMQGDLVFGRLWGE